MYDILIVTHLPAFYKVNLYKEISKNSKIMVVFVGHQSSCRTSDFVSNDFNFDHVFLFDGEFERRPKIKSLINLYSLVKTLSFNQLLVSGWDLPEFWFLVFINKKNKNNLALESTVYESASSGFKGIIKRVFLSRVARVLASGNLHKELLFHLGYKGDVRITKGVGIINKPDVGNNRKHRDRYQGRFLFLGRLSPEKNLFELLKVFKDLPCSSLTLIGNGPLSSYLSKIKTNNVEIREHIDNKDLSFLFCEYDFLILPSLREPWGLVIEESLYFNVPVIVSSHCGGAELINHGINGYVVEPDYKSIHGLLSSISEKGYELLSKDIYSHLAEKDSFQISSYKDL
ncbi:glycosyltransferase [Endozoicomonas sp.]|uniref:glycosyltransferase n=1 Tax=Endozoicomonas sp. TaxID=1892382 RepID=UPI003AF70BF9